MKNLKRNIQKWLPALTIAIIFQSCASGPCGRGFDYVTKKFDGVYEFKPMDSTLHKESIDSEIDVKELDPVFDIKLLQSRINYPEHLFRNCIQEKVIVKVLLDKDGSVVKLLFDKGHCREFIEEIIRCLRMEDIKITPAVYQGKYVMCWMTLPISFAIK